jgi:nucleotide-binding universal stress UspA family protein
MALDPADPIVVALALREDDRAVVELARALAALTGAWVALVHAFPFQALIALPEPPHWVKARHDEAVSRLEGLAAEWGDGTPASVRVQANPAPVRALHEAAEELGASFLVAGATHRGKVGRAVPGGVGERLLHAAPCPVALAPRGYERPPAGLRRIGVAVKRAETDAGGLALAAELADRVGIAPTTFTVADHDVSPTADRVLHGDPATELAAISSDLDLLVCGSRGYGPVRSQLVGGVSWDLAQSARCPLLVVPRAPAGG